MSEEVERKILPALSNSRQKCSNMRLEVSIDRLTITGKVSAFAFEKAAQHWLDTVDFFQSAGDGGFQVLDYSNCDQDDFGHRHERVDPEQVAYIEMPKFSTDMLRIDFNPNHSMHTPAGRWLLDEVIGKIPERHFSRCDVAFDIYDQPQISGYRVWEFGISRKFFYGRGGDLQTAYFGSRGSRKQVRLYNKKLELEKRHGRYVNASALWRLELQLRGSNVDDYVNQVRSMLEKFYAPDWRSAGSISNQMAVYALQKNPDLYSQMSHATKFRYRKMIRECKPDNSLSREMAFAFVDQYEVLEGTLQEMMRRYHVTNMKVK